eukprot:203612_1
MTTMLQTVRITSSRSVLRMKSRQQRLLSNFGPKRHSFRNGTQLRQMATAASSALDWFGRSVSSFKDPERSPMFCYQCEQTEGGTGCVEVGVCGKTPEVAGLQDLLVDRVKQISSAAVLARSQGKSSRTIDRFVTLALFSTLTNVNFDENRFVEYLRQAAEIQDQADVLATGCNSGLAKSFDAYSLHENIEAVGVQDRRVGVDPNIFAVQELTMYGIKGLAAYCHHAEMLGAEDDAIYADIHELLASLTEVPSLDTAVSFAMKAGEVNLRVLAMLDEAHRKKFGEPSPTPVSMRPVPGKCILVSGHDIQYLSDLLEATKDTGINVYTHGELLSAHGYPKLRETYSHLAGHFGGPWQLQKLEFRSFPGPIIMTTNCLMEPRRSYKNRLFTMGPTAWPGVKHISGNDFSDVIARANEEKGFSKMDEMYDDLTGALPASVTTGFGHTFVLGLADKILEAIKAGDIKRFYVIGGCDGSEAERSYFTELARSTPKESVILTMGCGKYRLNHLQLGEVAGLPRVLDMGQCNDAYGAVKVAMGLAEALNTDIQHLPISYAVSWFEQKAVAILLTLLHLNVQNIHLGPKLPAFLTDDVLAVLVEKFGIKPITNYTSDLKGMQTDGVQ